MLHSHTQQTYYLTNKLSVNIYIRTTPTDYYKRLNKLN